MLANDAAACAALYADDAVLVLPGSGADQGQEGDRRRLRGVARVRQGDGGRPHGHALRVGGQGFVGLGRVQGDDRAEGRRGADDTRSGRGAPSPSKKAARGNTSPTTRRTIRASRRRSSATRSLPRSAPSRGAERRRRATSATRAPGTRACRRPRRTSSRSAAWS